MVSFIDLFNPTFFIFLGILMLAMAFLVIYFENKMRDQNHKISSMLSLVSTLADDLNGVKMGLNHLIIKGGNSFNESSNIYEENLGKITTQDLIEVSDDEDSNNDSDNDSDNDSNDGDSSDIDLEINEIGDTDNESKYDDDDDDDNSSIEKENIKVLKLNILKENQDSENNELDLEETLDLDCDFEPGDELPEMTEEYVGKVLDLKYENLTEAQALEESQNTEHILGSDLKTISINLGEDEEEEEKGEVNIDYKKLPLQKLRSIVVEKGLASNSEVSKLKKPELLKIIDA
jgi:hypothetical protein